MKRLKTSVTLENNQSAPQCIVKRKKNTAQYNKESKNKNLMSQKLSN